MSMNFFNRDAAWYASPEGVKTYEGMRTIEERTLFLYSYLQKALHNSFDKDNTTFRFALFLADAVSAAPLPYNHFPALIDPRQNPYLAYLINLGKHPGKRVIYYGFMSILHGIGNAMLRNDWIYDTKLLDSEALEKKLVELDRNFYEESELFIPSPLAFDIAEELDKFQMQLIWFFNKK